MQMNIDGLHFSKENIMDYTNLLLTMNDLKKEKKHYKRTYSIFKQ